MLGEKKNFAACQDYCEIRRREGKKMGEEMRSAVGGKEQVAEALPEQKA